jgi:NitT/TauT family transport system substrate-binding protein
MTSPQKVLLVLLVIGSGVGCDSAPRQPVTLRIGTYATQDFLPYFVMREQGFDAKNGLVFAETRYEGGAAVIDAMAAGLLDIGYVGTVPLLAGVDRSLVPGKIIGIAGNNVADSDHPASGVLSNPLIKDWQELDGKYVAVNAATSIMAVALEARLSHEGVRAYQLVEIPFANMGLAVAGGNVAAAAMYDPFLTQSLLRGDGRLLGWIIGSDPFPRMVTTVTVASASLREKRPGVVKAFLRAHLAAIRWINHNAGGSRFTLMKYLSLSKNVGEKLRLLRWPLDQRHDSALLNDMQKVLLKVGTLGRSVATKEIFDETLLGEVMAENR